LQEHVPNADVLAIVLPLILGKTAQTENEVEKAA